MSSTKTITLVARRQEVNGLIEQQYSSLQEKGYTLYWGIDFFWERSHSSDIFIFHWPENLTERYEGPTDSELQSISERFKEIQSKSRIITYFHNEYPHYRDFINLKRLYELFYLNSDLVIHFGEYSKTLFAGIYPQSRAKSVVIPHPIYDSHNNTKSREEAREILQLDLRDNILLVFGSLRNKEEVKLFLRAFGQAKVPGKKLLVIKGKLYHYSGLLERVYTNIYVKLHSKGLIYVDRTIANNELDLYLNACDVLFIPRVKSLNSGLLPLAFTYGKVVVGPGIGNIEEYLRATGNPVFNPTNNKSVVTGIEESFKLKDLDQGKINKQFGAGKWNQSAITDLLIHALNTI